METLPELAVGLRLGCFGGVFFPLHKVVVVPSNELALLLNSLFLLFTGVLVPEHLNVLFDGDLHIDLRTFDSHLVHDHLEVIVILRKHQSRFLLAHPTSNDGALAVAQVMTDNEDSLIGSADFYQVRNFVNRHHFPAQYHPLCQILRLYKLILARFLEVQICKKLEHPLKSIPIS